MTVLRTTADIRRWQSVRQKALMVACPKCGAAPRDSCVGRDWWNSHKVRFAIEAQK